MFSTAPDCTKTHWKQTVFLLESPIPTKTGLYPVHKYFLLVLSVSTPVFACSGVCVQTVMRSGKYICSHHLFLEHTKNVSQGGVSYLSLAWQLILRRWHRLSVSHWEIDTRLSSSRASPHKPCSLFLLFINIYDDIYCIYCVWKIIPTGFQNETTHQVCRQIYLQ